MQFSDSSSLNRVQGSFKTRPAGTDHLEGFVLKVERPHTDRENSRTSAPPLRSGIAAPPLRSGTAAVQGSFLLLDPTKIGYL